MPKSLEYSRVVNFNPSRDPHGWIQWKGTNVCIDIYCSCGGSSHFDGDFMYYIECPHCGKIYEANGHIELIHVNREFAEGETSEIKIANSMVESI